MAADLMQLLAGRLLPEDYLAQQDQSGDPLTDYLGAYNQDYYGPATELTGQLGGLDNPKYAFTNTLKTADQLSDRAIAGAKAQFQGVTDARDFGLKQDQFGLAQNKDTRETEAFASKYSTAEQDAQALAMQGIDEKKIRKAFDTNDVEAINQIAIAMGLTDPNDANKPAWQTPTGFRRMTELEQYHDNQRVAGAQDADAQLVNEVKQRRWGTLDPQMRAKEMWMKQNHDPTAIVDRNGKVYTGPDAEKQAAPNWFNQDTRVPLYKPSTRKTTTPGKKDQGTTADQSQQGDLQYLLSNAQALGNTINREAYKTFVSPVKSGLGFLFGNKPMQTTSVDKWLAKTARGALTDKGEKQQQAAAATTKKK